MKGEARSFWTSRASRQGSSVAWWQHQNSPLPAPGARCLPQNQTFPSSLSPPAGAKWKCLQLTQQSSQKATEIPTAAWNARGLKEQELKSPIKNEPWISVPKPLCAKEALKNKSRTSNRKSSGSNHGSKTQWSGVCCCCYWCLFFSKLCMSQTHLPNESRELLP